MPLMTKKQSNSCKWLQPSEIFIVSKNKKKHHRFSKIGSWKVADPTETKILFHHSNVWE